MPRGAFERLAAANPVRDRDALAAIPIAAREEVLRRALAADPERPRQRNRRRSYIVAVAVVLVSVPSYAIAAGVAERFRAQPAPPSVVDEFETYTPQLGFNPRPDAASLVARDRGVALYVTPNAQGTWCYIVSTRNDGGTCVHEKVARSRVAAGLAGSAPDSSSKRTNFVLVGRIRDAAARSVTFTAPDGTEHVGRVGASGYFVAVVDAGPVDAWCTRGWSPLLTFADAEGGVLLSSTFEFTRPVEQGCVMTGVRIPDGGV